MPRERLVGTGHDGPALLLGQNLPDSLYKPIQAPHMTARFQVPAGLSAETAFVSAAKLTLCPGGVGQQA